jgi:lipoyl(octanoyl) transferase
LTAEVLDLARLSYTDALQVQLEVLQAVQEGRRPNTLIFVEHNPVLTLGANFHEENLLSTPDEYRSRGIEVLPTDRGGDVTYHGPGQLVIYPIFDVSRLGKDLHKWLRDLEQTMIRCVEIFGLQARRFPPHTGVWIEARKVAAIGIKVKRWVSMHGIALNCANDLSVYDTFVPCGIRDYGVTSLSEELGRTVPISEAKPVVKRAFAEVFGLDWVS